MVGRGRPPPPPQVARDEGIRPRRRNMEDEENMYGKLKFNMPKFKGEDDAEAYLSWALKVDKIFRIHNYSGAKKVAMASLEFEDYANTWWEQVVTLREEKGDPPIDTWEDMKEEMQARFVPTHYKTDLFNKLQKLKQGTKTVEEFFKEMELTMMRANIQESENQTIARFFNGLNYPIKKIVEFQPYSNMVELVHQASKAERQVNEDIKYSKSKQYFASKLATSTPTTSVKPSASSTPSKQPSIQSRMKQTVSSTASSKASTGPSNVTCFKCGTQGHKSFECKNTKVMITMENGDIETLSEGEYEALVQAAVANEEDYDEESGEDPLLCTHDPSPSLVVTRVLTTQPQAMEDQRCNIFQTRAGIGGKSIKVIIDGGSCHNLASTELCEKLNLTLRKHPHPYHVQWLSDKGNVKIQHTVTVNFKIGPYEDTVECDVVPMTVCHMLLGRPWQFDKKAIHDGFSNAYTFKVKDKKFELRPMTPSQIIADNAKALARAQHHIHHSELRGEGATHQKESERHHPHMSERKSVLLTTKSEWREVKDNPSTTIHYVLICKGLSAETNDLTNIPSSLLSLLKEFQDVFPDELPHGLPPLRGIEHRIDLIPGAPLPNRAAYRTNPEDTKEIQRQIQDLLAKGLLFVSCFCKSHMVAFGHLHLKTVKCSPAYRRRYTMAKESPKWTNNPRHIRQGTKRQGTTMEHGRRRRRRRKKKKKEEEEKKDEAGGASTQDSGASWGWSLHPGLAEPPPGADGASRLPRERKVASRELPGKKKAERYLRVEAPPVHERYLRVEPPASTTGRHYRPRPGRHHRSPPQAGHHNPPPPPPTNTTTPSPPPANTAEAPPPPPPPPQAHRYHHRHTTAIDAKLF
ncbi:hypothetical protein QYE76_017146 [Lolium multiflorum]|uniref:CCHC-type domain-containing protein n=1 Tax=Lolium multiflorum TaxID=4521 RepID=A0AAD8VEC8_LOLMU|nr:hypothetical protein QYE76_017146 [Lolium multiflorum]